MSAASSPAFNPVGQSFTARLQAFLADSKAKYSVAIRKDSGRTAEWQQRLHICHMFLYNKYNSTTPLKTDLGKRTISWTHLSDPGLLWATAKAADILRTKANLTPTKTGTKWNSGFEPDREATEKQAKKLLSDAGVGNSGQAMVSAGLKPCGEPCRCGAGRSKHLSEEAADLNSTDLVSLEAKLVQAKAGDIDGYLKKFGLHRPLVNHPESPEKWHVEAIP